MAALETKFLPAADAALSLKSDEGKAAVVAGYASTFGGEPDSYGDLIEAGAYANTIKSWGQRTYELPMLLQHEGLPIGKWPCMAMREDSKGLYVEGELTPGHSVAADVTASLKHRAISGLSIGYRVKDASVDKKTGIRKLIEIDLREISVVSSPANEHARVEAIKSGVSSIREFEDFLCDFLRWPRGLAKAVAAEGFKAGANLGTRREASGDDEPRDGAGGANALLAAMEAFQLTPVLRG